MLFFPPPENRERENERSRMGCLVQRSTAEPMTGRNCYTGFVSFVCLFVCCLF